MSVLRRDPELVGHLRRGPGMIDDSFEQRSPAANEHSGVTAGLEDLGVLKMSDASIPHPWIFPIASPGRLQGPR